MHVWAKATARPQRVRARAIMTALDSVVAQRIRIPAKGTMPARIKAAVKLARSNSTCIRESLAVRDHGHFALRRLPMLISQLMASSFPGQCMNLKERFGAFTRS